MTKNEQDGICDKRKQFALLRLGSGNPMFGRHHSAKAKEKMKIMRAMREKHPNWKGGKSHCIDCGKELSYYNGKRCRKCNNTCFGKKPIKKICKICSKEFYVFSSSKNRIYCSRKCYFKSKKGKSFTETHCKNIKLSKMGALNPQWKNGITPLCQKIKDLSEYKEWRRKVFQQDNYICQECFRGGRKIHAHHHKKLFSIIFQEFLQQYSQFSPIEDKETLLRLTITYQPFWDINNGQTLCEDCHKINTFPERMNSHH